MLERIKESFESFLDLSADVLCEYGAHICIVLVAGAMLWVAFTLPNQPNPVDQLNDMKQQAIVLGYAEYNRTNGGWQWVTNNLAEKK
jgi:hypothetical protein